MISEAERSKIEKLLSQISRRSTSDGPTPHKDVFLLALVNIVQETATDENRFPLDERLDTAFEKVWKQFVPDQEYSLNRIELPFWYLQNDGIWKVIPNPGRELEVQSFPRATRRRILECIKYGQLSDEVFAFLKNQGTREYLKKCIAEHLQRRKAVGMPQSKTGFNPFIAYLNTLQGTDANNKGSLAESQAKNPLFKELRVPHPLAQEILAELTGENGGNVILTGHAGDGKSTLALEVIRALRKLPPDDPLKD